MRRDQTTSQPAAPPDAVRAWRREQLVSAGVRRERAQQLADDTRWDLHALLELVGRGCPPELAERIVAPLDGGPDGC